MRFLTGTGKVGGSERALEFLCSPCAALLFERDGANHLVDAATAAVEAAEHAEHLLDGELLGEPGLLELDAEPLAQRTIAAVATAALQGTRRCRSPPV
jgi:hypothetical protein